MNSGTLESRTLKPTADNSQLAAALRRAFERSRIKRAAPAVTVQIEGTDEPQQIPLPVLQFFAGILEEMSKGNAVTFIPIHAELTTQEAADMLNVSRPFLIGLLKAGKIPFREVGKHRRIRFEDLMTFKKQSDEKSRKALDELAAQAQELNMDD